MELSFNKISSSVWFARQFGIVGAKYQIEISFFLETVSVFLIYLDKLGPFATKDLNIFLKKRANLG